MPDSLCRPTESTSFTAQVRGLINYLAPGLICPIPALGATSGVLEFTLGFVLFSSQFRTSYLYTIICTSVLFLLVIYLLVLQFTVSDFGIFNLFLCQLVFTLCKHYVWDKNGTNEIVQENDTFHFEIKGTMCIIYLRKHMPSL
jgi:hypothetical protein